MLNGNLLNNALITFGAVVFCYLMLELAIWQMKREGDFKENE